jgi:hypothetical protein
MKKKDTPPEEMIAKADAPVVCTPPPGYSLLPSGDRPGDTLVFRGFNPSTGEPIWEFVPYPDPANGQVWTAGTNGPFWANQ